MIETVPRKRRKTAVKKNLTKILLCTPEVTELPEGMGNAANLVAAKGGGLGDISASLIRYLNDSKEYELHVVLPKYDNSIKRLADITNQQIDRLAIVLSGRGIHLVNDSAFSYLSTPYQEHEIHTSIRRALAFQRYIINTLLDWIQPDIVHCNDWMTSLVPAAARAKGIRSLFTLHNIFTERRTLMEIEICGMKPIEFCEWLYYERFPVNIKENWRNYFDNNRVDFTASAILACDYFNTVSETFLEELKDNHFSDLVPHSIYEMIKLKYEQGRALGILNAPGDNVNSKVMDNIINFNKHNMAEIKPLNKSLFQEKMGLPQKADVPLFFWPNRLYFQKAPELLVDNAVYFMKKYDLQFAVVANGDTKLEKKLERLSRNYSNIKYYHFDDKLSNLGKAGADFILMPSRYEPCGLPQMEAPRFGTLPIVRSTGGLKDTVEHLDVNNNKGNGFRFEIADKAGLEFGINEALKFYRLPENVKIQNLQRIMSESKRKFNLQKTAEKYMEVYQKLLSLNSQ
ncbi:MAG: glycogen/starch synthase [Candidatus Cloacimonetes bacterium]|nr:glycogen/starch synthase [Candidatus Cloacimonadota bacterium]